MIEEAGIWVVLMGMPVLRVLGRVGEGVEDVGSQIYPGSSCQKC